MSETLGIALMVTAGLALLIWLEERGRAERLKKAERELSESIDRLVDNVESIGNITKQMKEK